MDNKSRRGNEDRWDCKEEVVATKTVVAPGIGDGRNTSCGCGMETSLGQCKQTESEEYVILDLESVCLPADIPANTPYTLSSLSFQSSQCISLPPSVYQREVPPFPSLTRTRRPPCNPFLSSLLRRQWPPETSLRSTTTTVSSFHDIVSAGRLSFRCDHPPISSSTWTTYPSSTPSVVVSPTLTHRKPLVTPLFFVDIVDADPDAIVFIYPLFFRAISIACLRMQFSTLSLGPQTTLSPLTSKPRFGSRSFVSIVSSAAVISTSAHPLVSLLLLRARSMTTWYQRQRFSFFRCNSVKPKLHIIFALCYNTDITNRAPPFCLQISGIRPSISFSTLCLFIDYNKRGRNHPSSIRDILQLVEPSSSTQDYFCIIGASKKTICSSFHCNHRYPILRSRTRSTPLRTTFTDEEDIV
ncbi:hypothetical protein KSP39_PZI008388 [Platanthera zijinensis]|uniref:Uncharacterized protein n=1 Tax=Platanthera zijinensis TaxID=2320716 RepID=A0AAP0G9E7_9ASPA